MPVAGIEMEDEVMGGGGVTSLPFDCPAGKGVVVPFTHFRADRRFHSGQKNGGNGALSGNGDDDEADYFGSVECPSVTGFHAPIRTDDIFMLWGRNK